MLISSIAVFGATRFDVAMELGVGEVLMNRDHPRRSHRITTGHCDVDGAEVSGDGGAAVFDLGGHLGESTSGRP